MYITSIRNRKSPPAILLRDGYRENGKVKTRTLANLSKLPAKAIEVLRQVLIVRSYRSLQLADVYAVITRYLADPAPFNKYLRKCEEEAEALRRKLEAAGSGTVERWAGVVAKPASTGAGPNGTRLRVEGRLFFGPGFGHV